MNGQERLADDGTDALTVARPTDEKGRVLVTHMSDRELLEEMVKSLRAVGDAWLEVQSQMNGSAIGRMLGIGR